MYIFQVNFSLNAGKMKDFDSLGMLQGLLGTNAMAGSVSLHKIAFRKTLTLK